MPIKLKRLTIEGRDDINQWIEDLCTAVEWAHNPSGTGTLLVDHPAAGPRFRNATSPIQIIAEGLCSGGCTALSGTTAGTGTYTPVQTNASTGAITSAGSTVTTFWNYGGAVSGPFYGVFGFDGVVWLLLVAKCP